METTMKGLGFRVIVPPKWIEYGVYGDLIVICPKPYSIHLRGTRISSFWIPWNLEKMRVSSLELWGKGLWRVQT